MTMNKISRTTFRAFQFWIILCVITACGGGGGGPASDPIGDTNQASITQLNISSSSTQVAYGENLQLHAQAVYSDGSKKDVSNQATWSSSSTGIATIDNNGQLSSHQAGDTVVSASFDGITNTLPISIYRELVDIQISVTGTNLIVGASLQLHASGIYSDHSVRDISSQAVWSSQNSSVANINETGVISALNPGSAVMTAELDGISGETTVSVEAASIVSIAVTPKQSSTAAGASIQLQATAYFNNGTFQNTTSQAVWQSQDTTIASVSESGLLLGVKEGSTTISASLGNVSGNTTITITPATLTDIQITPSQPSVANGHELQMTAVGIYSDGSHNDITQNVTWASQNEEIATISNVNSTHGWVTSLTTGTTEISAQLGNITKTVTLTVTDATLVSLDISPNTATIPAGENINFHATAVYSDNKHVDVTNLAVWSSNNNAIATVSNGQLDHGTVNAVAPGDTNITAHFGGIQASATLKVNDALLTNIEIAPNSPTIFTGTKQALTATGHYGDGSNRDLTDEVTWQSSNESAAAIVDGNSVQAITSTGNGSIQVSASLGDIIGFTSVKVADAALVSIEITATNTTIAKGTQQNFTATGHYQGNQSQDISTQVTWLSSNEDIANISNANGEKGVANGNNAGITNITAQFGDIISNSLPLTVTAETLNALTIALTSNATVYVGQVRKLSATGHFTDDSEQDLTQTVTWSSSDPSIAVVSNTQAHQGEITILKEGAVTISANRNGIQSNLAINTVNNPDIPGSISITASPNVILNDGVDSSEINIVVKPLGEGGNVANENTNVDILVTLKTADAFNLIGATSVALDASGQVSYNITSIEQGIIFITATVHGMDITKTTALVATNHFGNVIQTQGAAAIDYNNGVYTAGSRLYFYARNLSNRPFDVNKIVISNGSISNTNNEIESQTLNLAGGDNILSSGETMSFIYEFDYDTIENNAQQGVQWGAILTDPVKNTASICICVGIAPGTTN